MWPKRRRRLNARGRRRAFRNGDDQYDQKQENTASEAAYAIAFPNGIAGAFGQGWKGTREHGGNNLGNTFHLVFSRVFISLLVFVPLFSLNSSLFNKRPLQFLILKKTKSSLPISTSSRQEQGTREQSAFEPCFLGVFVFPRLQEQPAPCSPSSPERCFRCPVR